MDPSAHCQSCGHNLLTQTNYALYFDGYPNGPPSGFRCDLCFYRDSIIVCSMKLLQSMTANHRDSVELIRKIEEELDQIMANHIVSKTTR